MSVEPEQGEVINGPNLGGFLGLAPDLRRLGRQGLAWLSGTQGLSGPGIWAFPKERLCCDPAGNGSLAGHVALPSQQGSLFLFTPEDFPAADLPRAADLRRRIFSFSVSSESE